MKRGWALAVALCGTVLVGASSAAGGVVHPRPGAIYSGKITETSGTKVLASQRIVFTVAGGGKTVYNFILRDGYPVYCDPRGIAEVQSATAKVYSTGEFTAKLPIYAKHHRLQGDLIVTGAFTPHNGEYGTVKTLFMAADRKSCNGTAAYKTKTK
jgi:hypothetical protein